LNLADNVYVRRVTTGAVRAEEILPHRTRIASHRLTLPECWLAQGQTAAIAATLAAQNPIWCARFFKI
jgi:hypothetical protein